MFKAFKYSFYCLIFYFSYYLLPALASYIFTVTACVFHDVLDFVLGLSAYLICFLFFGVLTLLPMFPKYIFLHEILTP